ncbi:MAG: hypothetical protein ACXWV2_03255 [Chitinophagaceae bacterium]
MKYLLLLFIFFGPLLLSAQDSTAIQCNLVKETDPYTRETKISSGFISLQGATLTIDADNKEIDFFFAVPDKCFADASTVFIFFEGSKIKTTYRNSGSMNCNGYFHFVFKNGITTPTVLKKLASQKVANFIFTGTDKKATIVSLLPDQQQLLMESTACIVQESQSLIKK